MHFRSWQNLLTLASTVSDRPFKLCKMTSFKLYTFMPMSETLFDFQGHHSARKSKVKDAFFASSRLINFKLFVMATTWSEFVYGT